MVKADLSRDYYGDLGLEPGADLDAIKKQFKKLGMARSLLITALSG
jgi:curved DNA-binding protein CbpA